MRRCRDNWKLKAILEKDRRETAENVAAVTQEKLTETYRTVGRAQQRFVVAAAALLVVVSLQVGSFATRVSDSKPPVATAPAPM